MSPRDRRKKGIAPPQTGSLFGRLNRALILALLGVQLLTMLITSWVILLPVVDVATEDLTLLILWSEERYRRASAAERPSVMATLERETGLRISTRAVECTGRPSLPYLQSLRISFSERGENAVIGYQQQNHGERWYCVQLKGRTPNITREITFAFPHSRIGTRPSGGILSALALSVGIMLLTALLVARGLVRPLNQLGVAAERIGRGQTPERLDEKGPRELARLSRIVNRLADRVRDLVRARTVLLAGISHDLKAPLSRLGLRLELLRARIGEAETDSLQHQVERLAQQIDQSLSVGRAMAQEAIGPVDLIGLLRALTAQMGTPDNPITLALRPEGLNGCQRLLAQEPLERIVMNFLENARHHGGTGTIDLTLFCDAEGAKEQGESWIEVADRGPGIPETERARVFEPFVRLAPRADDQTAGAGGSGLGLAICAQLANAHGWTVTLEPRPGGGTRARLKLGGREPPSGN